ncbi:DUF2971 domain-containing protein [Leifsonia aquatica]|uniref:DUF2971 domain-containing protein n=1 Tax=Leifsonia aquatica TaxID=144185 RepID=UPI0038508389
MSEVVDGHRQLDDVGHRSSVPLPPVVYHYTDARGFLGILENRRLWLTDLAFMNDREELIFAVDEVLHAVEARRHLLEPDARMDDPEDAIRSRVNVLLGIEQHLVDLREGVEVLRAYAACFCDDGDQLSQWRGYAGGTSGFALGFDRSKIDQLAIGAGVGAKLGRVHYGVEAPEIETLVAELAMYASAHPGVEAEYQYQDVVNLLSRIKNPGFREERESRLVALLAHDPSRLSFRATASGLAPYLECPFPPEALVEVVVGPGERQDVHALAARQAIDKHGFRGSVDPFFDFKVRVRKSTISYR